MVLLGAAEPWLPKPPAEVTLSNTVVDVAVHRKQRRSHFLSEWIELHLDAAILAARPGGFHLDCGDPIWLEP